MIGLLKRRDTPKGEGEGTPTPSPSPTGDRGEGGGVVLPAPPTGKGPPPKRFTCIFGGSGTGKTLYALAAYARAIVEGARGIVVDFKGEYSHMGAACGSVPELLDYVRGRTRFNAVLNAEGLDPELDMDPVWRAVAKMGRVVVLLDEAEVWAHSGSGNKLKPESLRRVIGHGRSRGIGLLSTCRQVTELHRDMRNSATTVISFRHEDPKQAKAAASYFNAPVEDHLMALDDLHFLRVEKATGRMTYGRVYPPGTPQGDRALRGGR